jgi:VIT1/CCC1 family predicted Fe2+/Mn2+ transporter
MNTRQWVIVVILLVFNILAVYFAILGWITGPEWRILAGTLSCIGFLFVLVYYVRYLLQEMREKTK